MSMPRVGSKQSSVWNPPTSQRAMPTFCWLPPVGRDEHHSGADRVGRMPKSARLAADHYLAGLRPAHPGQAVEQLLLALTLERGDTEHLAEAKRECDVVQGAGLEV